MRTDHLIEALTRDAAAKVTLKPATWLFVALGSAALAFVVFAGFRADLPGALLPTVGKLVFTLGFVIVGGLFLVRMRQPWPVRRVLVAFLVLYACLAFAGIALDLSQNGAAGALKRFVGTNPSDCLRQTAIIGALPLAAFLLFLRQGAPENGVMAGAVAGLSAGALGASFFALQCTNDSPLYVLFWYAVAILLLAVIGSALGRIVLKW